ncbi:hypothetical protein Vafri_20754 [Volvox africanus]|uniref:Uncharacterized protein n=1 Tax=Volvox africanus TaxID=51714 RepID=A0A8J4FAP9_9CHLO|nr:hypothetical protein Vafri_20754 [Volvox africanus]
MIAVGPGPASVAAAAAAVPVVSAEQAVSAAVAASGRLTLAAPHPVKQDGPVAAAVAAPDPRMWSGQAAERAAAQRRPPLLLLQLQQIPWPLTLEHVLSGEP